MNFGYAENAKIDFMRKGQVQRFIQVRYTMMDHYVHAASLIIVELQIYASTNAVKALERVNKYCFY